MKIILFLIAALLLVSGSPKMQPYKRIPDQFIVKADSLLPAVQRLEKATRKLERSLK